jgi:dissimilatory sulfite reductase (desulfoviridin) alpha/beta subunit
VTQRLETAEGILPQRQKGYVTLRFAPDGKVTAEQMKTLADLAEEEGKGIVLFTMRKTLELPWIRVERAPQVLEKCRSVGLETGSTGGSVRAVLPCASAYRCAFEATDVMKLYGKLMEKYYRKAAPAKFKITISGCPNFCTHPYLHDIGIIGRIHPVINLEKCIGCGQCARICRGEAIDQEGAPGSYPDEPLPTGLWEKAAQKNRMPLYDATTPLDAITLDAMGNPKIDYEKCIDCGLCVRNCPTDAIEVEKSGFTVMVGGRGGRRSIFGIELVHIASEELLFQILDRTLEYHRKYAGKRERFADVLERMGMDHYREEALRGLDLEGEACSTRKAREVEAA